MRHVDGGRDDAPGRLGIVGGMGPLASARFLDNLYRRNLAAHEQAMPNLVLWSDPTVPDRTGALAAGRADALEVSLRRSLEHLIDCGCDRIVIACFTIHAVLPRLPAPLTSRVVSLVDVALAAQRADPRPRLLLTTDGTRDARTFEGHRDWPRVMHRVRRPGEEDQRRLHAAVYALKAGAPAAPHCLWLEDLVRDRGVEGLIFGCTELHLLHDGGALPTVIDPLQILIAHYSALMTDPARLTAGDSARRTTWGPDPGKGRVS